MPAHAGWPERARTRALHSQAGGFVAPSSAQLTLLRPASSPPQPSPLTAAPQSTSLAIASPSALLMALPLRWSGGLPPGCARAQCWASVCSATGRQSCLGRPPARSVLTHPTPRTVCFVRHTAALPSRTQPCRHLHPRSEEAACMHLMPCGLQDVRHGQDEHRRLPRARGLLSSGTCNRRALPPWHVAGRRRRRKRLGGRVHVVPPGQDHKHAGVDRRHRLCW